MRGGDPPPLCILAWGIGDSLLLYILPAGRGGLCEGGGSPSFYILSGGSSIPLHPFGGFFRPFASLRGGRADLHPRFAASPPALHPCTEAGGCPPSLRILALGRGCPSCLASLRGGPSTSQLFMAGGVESFTFCTSAGRGGGQAAPHVFMAWGRDPGSAWHRGAPGLSAPLRWGGGVCAVTSHSYMEREGDPAALHPRMGAGWGRGASFGILAILGREDPSSFHHGGG